MVMINRDGTLQDPVPGTVRYDEQQRANAQKEKDKEVDLSEKLYFRYKSARTTWEQNAKKDQEFRNGIQWEDSEVDELTQQKLSAVVVNLVYPAVEQAKAMLTTNKPRFQATPKEGSDGRVAAAISDLLSHIWEHNRGNAEFKQFVDDYYVVGMGVWGADIDPIADNGRGEVRFRSVDPFTVFIDPASQDRFARDAAHILIRTLITESQIKQLPKDYSSQLPLMDATGEQDPRPVTTLTGTEGRGALGTDYEDKKYEVIDRYTRVHIARHVVNDPGLTLELALNDADFQKFLQRIALVEVSANGAERYLIHDKEIAQTVSLLGEGVLTEGGTYHFVTAPGDPSQTPIPMPGPENELSDSQQGFITQPNSEVKVVPVTMGDLIQKGYIQHVEEQLPRVKRVYSIGGLRLYNEILELERIPLIIVMNNHDRNPYPTSDVRQVREQNRFINKTRTLIIAHAANTANVKVFLPRGSMDEEKLREAIGRVGVGIATYDAELGQPVFAQPIPLPSELYQLEAQARATIQEVLGIYPFQQGDVSNSPETFKGTLMMDEMGQRRIKAKLDDLEEGLNQLAPIMLTLSKQVYTKPKIVRLQRPNNIETETRLNYPIFDDTSNELIEVMNDLSKGEWDVIVVSGSTLPSNRWARFEYYMSLYQQGIIDRTEVLKQTEIVDTQGVLERMSEISQLQQQLSMAMEEIKKLRGDLQTAERESVHDRKRVEIEKFKTDLAEQKAKMGAAATVFDSQLQVELQKARLEVAERKKKTAAES